MTKSNVVERRSHLWLRILLAFVGAAACLWLLVDSSRTGAARFLNTIAIIQPNVEPADLAVKMSPSDPEAHYTRALSLVNLQRLPEAIIELRQAIRLRPNYYYQWLDLGVTLDRLGDQTGAAAAIEEAVRLAPGFAQPRWQLGNLLFRQGLYDRAFEQMRLAVSSNPSLSENTLELAWAAADGDPNRFEALIQPQTSRKRFELAAFLSRQGLGDEAVSQIRKASTATTEAELHFLRLTINQLIAAQKFDDAFLIWAASHGVNADSQATPKVFNGSFTGAIRRNDPGFGWQLGENSAVTLSIDPAGPQPSSRSIRVDFGGESPPQNPVLRQLALVQKDSTYTLGFMAKAEQLVSGGLPLVAVLDASKDRVLGQSNPISNQNSDWTRLSVEFAADSNTPAIVIAVMRQPCNQTPCPIFGHLWLSDFRLTRK